jgi:hypothetical protein
MKRLCKIVSALLIFVMCASFTSCENDRDYDEAEVLSNAALLIEKSYKLNELFYGKGLKYGDVGVGIYKRAEKESLDSYGISTIEDMKNMAREIFSDSYCNAIFSSDVFSSLKIDNVVKSYARYYEDKDNEKNPVIMVRSNYEPLLNCTYVYSSAMEVVDVEGEIIVINTLVTATNKEGSVKNINVKLRMIEEDDGWRFTGPTYVVYNEYADLYEDLKNNK